MSVPKILLVDDDLVLITIIAKHLTDAGFNVTSAIDAKVAFEKLETILPDLIITDILMPLTSGLDLIGRIRSIYGNKIPILVLSAIEEEDTIMEAFNLGAEDFLCKPVKPTELLLRVKKLLKQNNL